MHGFVALHDMENNGASSDRNSGHHDRGKRLMKVMVAEKIRDWRNLTKVNLIVLQMQLNLFELKITKVLLCRFKQI